MTTKNWGATQEQNLPVDKSKKLSVAEQEKAFGDKDLGTVLNEIADPNYIDPSKVQRERKTDLDKDAFFKLMLTQMKNQDPMNPMQSHEMAAHLAQFTSLEQMFNMNEHLQALRSTQNPMKDYQALSFIGKEISADSSLIVRNKDDASHELRFNLLGEASDAKVKITNEAGELVREMTLNTLKKGQNVARWDGFNDQGQKLNEGEYKFEIVANNNAGKRVTVDTSASGRITGVQFTKKGPLLLIGNQQVYLSDVKKIREPVPSQEPAGVIFANDQQASEPGGNVAPVQQTNASPAVKPAASAKTEALPKSNLTFNNGFSNGLPPVQQGHTETVIKPEAKSTKTSQYETQRKVGGRT